MKKVILQIFLLWIVLYSSSGEACAAAGKSDGKFGIKYQKYILGNGLEVILHEDHSDPIVAVATLVHVGSNREKPGRTGFAHFFEHMSFNDSENVPLGANRKMIPELGGQRNGGTSTDGTYYFEVVPRDAFEKIMWIDSDRMGFMINTVTEEALEREKQVVKNEKRERVDNSPYGYTDEVQRKALYPEGHPYSWTVIGSLPDLQAATLDDVKEFYEAYYGAGNATLVIAGDINIEQTKDLVERWFGEIRRGPDVNNPEKNTPVLGESRSLFHEDNFATLPELQMVFPTVPQYHPDSYAMKVLGYILSGSKKSALYKVIVEERKLAPEVYSYSDIGEISGTFNIIVRANAGIDLDEVKSAIDEGFARFEREGINGNELKKVKAQLETGLYTGIETVLDKALQLAVYNEYAGDPGYIAEEARLQSRVSAEDVMDVYERYIKGKNHIMTCFVPKEQAELAVSGAERADIWEEEITPGQEFEKVSQGKEAECEKTATKHDRSEPPLGDLPLLKSPVIWKGKFDNGIAVCGIESEEIPLVAFDLTIRGGHLLDPMNKAGAASLLSSLMMEGTKDRTPAELEEAIGLLGASVDVVARDEEIVIAGSALAKNFEETLDLMTDIVLEPRWDQIEFERLKRETMTELKDSESDPNAIASGVFRRLLYGEKHIMGLPVRGTLETAADISMDDLKDFYSKSFSPSVASFHVVGDIGKDRVMKALRRLGRKWKGFDVEFPLYEAPRSRTGSIYFIDMPGAKQSNIFAGKLALSASDEDFNNLMYANQALGGGSSGRLFQTLRIEKGYTYGAYSSVAERAGKGYFVIYTSVRTNVTKESIEIIRDIIGNYGTTFGSDDMETTKNKVIKGNTLAFESLNAKKNILSRISKFGYPENYLELHQDELMGMELGDFRNMISKYLTGEDLIYVVVGDAQTQLQNLLDTGLGTPVRLDIYGNPLD